MSYSVQRFSRPYASSIRMWRSSSRPISEPCVWGKAYFPLTLGASVVILGGAVTALLYAALMWRRRRQSRDGAW